MSVNTLAKQIAGTIGPSAEENANIAAALKDLSPAQMLKLQDLDALISFLRRVLGREIAVPGVIDVPSYACSARPKVG